MYNHGGEHQWDLTEPQARWVFEVSTQPAPCILPHVTLLITFIIVDQYSELHLQSRHPIRQSRHSPTLPSRLRRPPWQRSGLDDSIPNSLSRRLRICGYVDQNLAVRAADEDMDFIPRWALHKYRGIHDYEWGIQYGNGCYHLGPADQGGLEFADDHEGEIGNCVYLYDWIDVSSTSLLRRKRLCILHRPAVLILHCYSAPIFSLVGMIVRIKIAASDDVTYNQPKIHLFA